MSNPLPFPSTGTVKGAANAQDADAMRIDIPRSKEEQAAAHHAGHRKLATIALNGSQHSHDGAGTGAVNTGPTSGASASSVPVPPRGSSASASHSWQHHPRQPHQTGDSYFPNSGASSLASSIPGVVTGQPPRTPGSIRNTHSRQTSVSSAQPVSNNIPSAAAVTAAPSTAGRKAAHSMSLSLSGGPGQTVATAGHPDSFADFGQGHHHAGPPSPSTLTDIILALHSTLYGAKRTAEEVREMVSRFYDQDAVFESPLLAASGREQIANQFIMAFTLPGMDVKSELRDVICSDFEFDGTRAGIIDQTISVTFMPSLFGSSDSSAQAGYDPAAHAPTDYHHDRGGSSTPAYTLHSAITPHPFASYSQSHTPAGAGSTFGRYTSQSQGHSPTTPYSMTSMWGNSRPHTPGTSSHIRPLSHSFRPSTPPSVNGDDGEEEMGNSHSTIQGHDELHFMSTAEAGGGQVARPPMPQDALLPHWSAQGLGRSSVRAFLWGVFHPRAVLKHLCTIHLRLMSRLEFNDVGQIVRHEDTWGVRETIEGTIPFASVIYALERRVVGYICSFAVGRGFRLSNALARHAIGPAAEKHRRHWSLEPGEQHYGRGDANEAAHALLLGYHRQEKIQSMARSRASSPTRHRFAHHGPHTASAGSRSRARSLIGGPQSAAPTRNASSDNLLSIGYGDRERHNTHGGETLPPDSGARYRTGSRRITTSTASAPVGHPTIGLGASAGGGSLDSMWQQADIYGASIDGAASSDAKARAPDRDH